jgi:hypothetical protein
MKNERLSLSVLIASLLLIGGCLTRPAHNPLEGWHFSSLGNLEANKAITQDYQQYIQKLPPEERKFVGNIKFFEDGTGQHAVEIRIDLHGTWWKHVLIYDGNDNRVKVVKYKFGNYRS